MNQWLNDPFVGKSCRGKATTEAQIWAGAVPSSCCISQEQGCSEELPSAGVGDITCVLGKCWKAPENESRKRHRHKQDGNEAQKILSCFDVTYTWQTPVCSQLHTWVSSPRHDPTGSTGLASASGKPVAKGHRGTTAGQAGPLLASGQGLCHQDCRWGQPAPWS